MDVSTSSLNTSILKNSLNKKRAPDRNSKRITFSPVVRHRLFAVNAEKKTIWEKTYDVIEVESDEAEKQIADEEDTQKKTTRKRLNSTRRDEATKKRKTTNDVFTIEKILGRRLRNGKTEYLIKWKEFSTKENSWEPETNLDEELVSKINKLIMSR